ncbi:DEAD/DEAH box helicase [Salipiger sp. IMCC34102]|uniref:DEAD/DEAH box helicase n=1 Tax=Salipiger sp. IMCC34102 TaxID=2510647 RepID=UPI00101D05D4|nr:DEAD/DEAH box helicase [Salipiger sp. IMCC34102]RYH03261.1 DEAD/DEAH box helicase [Salipiger sp. IMCC34102]
MTKFSDLNLDAKVLKAVADTGYETPTPIQAGAIPPALEGRDVLGIAQTGTGKTASFTLPMITLLGRGRARARMPRSLVLAPTRELAAQVAENFDAYAKYTKLTKALLIGGTSFKEQDALIDKGVDVLIATPGRLIDHFERGKLILSDVKIMVVDEADRMLDMGFIPDIERIFQMTPFTRQTLFFSATMAPEIERITNTFLSSPAKVEVARAATTGENIKQGVVIFEGSTKAKADREKRDLLRALIDAEGDACTNAIIFCNRKSDVDTVAKSLSKHGYDAAPIHGDLDQSHRTRTLEGFRDGTLRFLVASDVAARGLDIPAVTHVFNFDVPSHAEDYVHRIGRTGRAGRKGTAIMICAPRDVKNLEDVERLVQTTIPRLDNPTGTTPAEASETEAAPAAATEDKPKRTRSRSRRKDSPKPDESAPTASPRTPDPAAATEDAQTVAEDIHTEPAAKAPSQPRAAQTTEEPQSDAPKGGRSSRGGRGRARGGNDQREGQSNDKGGHGRAVVGMGEDVPDFIAKSFAERGAG